MNFFKLFSFSFLAPTPSSVPAAPVKEKDLTANILNEAANILERDGWAQDSYENKHGQKCAMEALVVAASPFPLGDVGEAERRLLKEIKSYASIIEWNDASLRTREEVISTIRRAAAK